MTAPWSGLGVGAGSHALVPGTQTCEGRGHDGHPNSPNGQRPCLTLPGGASLTCGSQAQAGKVAVSPPDSQQRADSRMGQIWGYWLNHVERFFPFAGMR